MGLLAAESLQADQDGAVAEAVKSSGFVSGTRAKGLAIGRGRRALQRVVVVIESDKGDTNRRLQQFERALSESQAPPRVPDEKVAHFDPRRNLQTWTL